MANVYRSNYNGLQVTLNRRNYHGLSMVAGYTYLASLDDVGANWDFGYGSGLPQNSYNVAAEYGNSDFDIRQPPNALSHLRYSRPERLRPELEGWEINSIITLQTPQYWGPIDEGTDAAGTGSLPVSSAGQRPDSLEFLLETPTDFKSGQARDSVVHGREQPDCPQLARQGFGSGRRHTRSCDTAAQSFRMLRQRQFGHDSAALGQFGNMGRNTFPDSGFKNVDFSVAKNWHFGERFRAQFRAEFFNIFNHPNLANPYGGQNGFGLNDPSAAAFGCGCATPDVAAANPVIGSGGSRADSTGIETYFLDRGVSQSGAGPSGPIFFKLKGLDPVSSTHQEVLPHLIRSCISLARF